MDKPYDFGELAGRLQAQGLDMAEEAAKIVVEEVLNWVGDSAVLSENKFDDLMLAVIPLIKPVILEQIDKIDGKVDL